MFDFSFCGNSDVMTKAAKAAFNASVDSGITFIDTAEVYGSSVGYKYTVIFTYYLNVP